MVEILTVVYPQVLGSGCICHTWRLLKVPYKLARLFYIKNGCVFFEVIILDVFHQ